MRWREWHERDMLPQKLKRNISLWQRHSLFVSKMELLEPSVIDNSRTLLSGHFWLDKSAYKYIHRAATSAEEKVFQHRRHFNLSPVLELLKCRYQMTLWLEKTNVYRCSKAATTFKGLNVSVNVFRTSTVNIIYFLYIWFYLTSLKCNLYGLETLLGAAEQQQKAAGTWDIDHFLTLRLMCSFYLAPVQ